MKVFWIFLFLSSAIFPKEFYLNQNVVSLYEIPPKNFCFTQMVYGEKVKLIESKEVFSLVQLPDNSKAYIKTKFLSENPLSCQNRAIIKSLFAHVYTKKSFSSKKLLTLIYGTEIEKTKFCEKGSWVEIFLFNGQKGFIRKSDLFSESSFTINKSELIILAQKLLFSPYLVGGTTPYGFDADGLIFFLFKNTSFSLPRKLHEQQNSLFLAVQENQKKPGDLIFFNFKRGQTESNHVGVYIGENYFIHASSGEKENEPPGVKKTFLTPYWKSRIIKILRPQKNKTDGKIVSSDSSCQG